MKAAEIFYGQNIFQPLFNHPGTRADCANLAAIENGINGFPTLYAPSIQRLDIGDWSTRSWGSEQLEGLERFRLWYGSMDTLLLVLFPRLRHVVMHLPSFYYLDSVMKKEERRSSLLERRR